MKALDKIPTWGKYKNEFGERLDSKNLEQYINLFCNLLAPMKVDIEQIVYETKSLPSDDIGHQLAAFERHFPLDERLEDFLYFDDRLKEVFDQSIAAGLWEGKYAANNHHEYWAEGVQSWFNNNRENDHDHNHVNTRAELKSYDSALAKVVEEVFGDTVFEYIRPPERKQQAHLEGYDYSKSPTFRWPGHLKILDITR